MRQTTAFFKLLLVAPLAVAVVQTPAAHADSVAYLVNVTVRPGYNFPNADAAIAYGHGVCNEVEQSESYSTLIANVKSDFNTVDHYQAAYLVNQAVNELCPAQIWRLRNSAAYYRGG
jgi:hypothetical protein